MKVILIISFAALVSDNTLTRAERSAVVVFLKSEYEGVEEKYGEETGEEDLGFSENVIVEINEEVKKKGY